jgi:Erv1 / Alr family
MGLDPKVWGPHYWFFLHTIAICYPHRPNTITKKKYYDFIQNIPIFIPVESMSTQFSQLLDQYPVTPYLDSRDAFIRWMHFIHNKINQRLEKPNISLSKFYEDYYEYYKPNDLKMRETYKFRSKIIYFVFLMMFLGFIFYFYNK